MFVGLYVGAGKRVSIRMRLAMAHNVDDTLRYLTNIDDENRIALHSSSQHKSDFIDRMQYTQRFVDAY